MLYPPVTIIIPVYNDSATLAACVRSICELTDYPDWRVVVVDDGSTDGSIATIHSFKQVRIVRKKRGGVASALNLGIEEAGGTDVVRLHADTVLESSEWLKGLAQCAASLPKAGVIGARLIYPDGRIHSEGRQIISALGFHPLHRNRRAFLPDAAHGVSSEVDSVAGSLCYYRKEALAAVGKLDEGFGMVGLEDDDFCISARLHGFKVYVQAEVRAVHYTRSKAPTFHAYVPGHEAELGQITSGFRNSAERLQSEYWKQKWGWDPLYPDLGHIRRLYGNSEICWQIGEAMRFKPTSDTPSVDCCIVTWNTLPLLKRCLDSLAATDYPRDRLNVIITDNASTDGTHQYLCELQHTYPFPLKVCRLAVNTGAPIGVNFAVVQGGGELVARLDDDIVLPPTWLKGLVAGLLKRPFAGCIGPKVINDDDIQGLQCGPYRHYPGIYGHDDEVDCGQADYVSRTTHVRGCCNLYRRDAFAKCGLLDGRFSPSQFDDPDHHIALLQAGFEILYDGRVRIIHKLNNGLARSASAIANQKANLNKMLGKWGADVFEVLETSIDLSAEGRYLPDDYNTGEWLEKISAGHEFPCKGKTLAPEKRLLVNRIYEQLAGAVKADTKLAQLCDGYLELSRIRHRDGLPRLALDILLVAASFAPFHPPVYEALAKSYQALGQYDMSRLMARRGLHLAPENLELRELSSNTASSPYSSGSKLVSIGDRMNAIGESHVTVGTVECSGLAGAKPLRVLMVNTFTPRTSGGDQSQLKKTRQYLERIGIHVDVCCTPRPDPRGYDVVHVWNTWFPHETLTQIKGMRAWRPDTPIALTPIYWDMAEKSWADNAVPALFAGAAGNTNIEQSLDLLATDKLIFNGTTRGNAGEPWRGYRAYQKQLFGLVDHLLPQSRAEMQNLRKTLGVELPFTIVENSAENTIFASASSDWFAKTYGVKDFILTVGLVEPRKNQLMLLHALKDSDIPIVIVGRHYDQRYFQLCRKAATKKTIFIEHLPHDQLASAMKAARVFALPSWVECASLANIEAALCGCALAVSDRTSEREYFGEGAYYCDPASVSSIRNAVWNALNKYDADRPKREMLTGRFSSKFTWEQAAQRTLEGYRAAIDARVTCVA